MSPTLPRFLPTALLILVSVLAPPLSAQKLKPARPVSKDIAIRATKEFRKTYKSRDAHIRLAAVDRLTTLKHGLIAKSLARVLAKDKAPRVRAQAALRLGQQDPKHVKKPLLIAWQSRKNRTTDEVLIAVLEAWLRLGKGPPLKVIRDRWNSRTKEVQQAVIMTSVVRRDLDTVAWLATLMDAPIPANVDSPTNPPASYWKNKMIRWRFWVDQVYDALDDLTNQDFESAREVRGWIRKGGKVLVRKKKER